MNSRRSRIPATLFAITSVGVVCMYIYASVLSWSSSQDYNGNFATYSHSGEHARRGLFNFREDFSLPHPQAYLPTSKIKNNFWLTCLRGYLTSIYPSRTVTITVATKSFIPNLLNWLISANLVADPPLEHIMTVAFDEPVYQLLAERNITAILVPHSSLIQNTFKGKFQKIWLSRLAIIRIINHWGYNVLQLDNDAILLRNPKPLFKKYLDFDVVASKGHVPLNLYKKAWGFTLCMGVILIRSSPEVENLWKAMHSKVLYNMTDDQARFNYVFNETQIVWTSEARNSGTEITGVNKLGVKVAIIPEQYICRKTCKKIECGYYIWHPPIIGHNPTHKMRYFEEFSKNFLDSQWRKKGKNSSIQGANWFRTIANVKLVETYHQRLQTPCNPI